MTAHHFERHPVLSGPLAGRPAQERCAGCSSRRTPAVEHSTCPPEWEVEGQI